MTANKGIGFEGMIELGDIDNSKDPFVTEVRQALTNLDDRILEQRNKLIDPSDEEAVKKYNKTILMATRPIEWSNKMSGFGYASSSLVNDLEKEVISAAIIARAFQKSEMKATPLIIPVDKLYTYYPTANPSFVTKTRLIFDRESIESGKQNYALLVSGFSLSKVFTGSTLEQIPSQKNVGWSLIGGKNTELAEKIGIFAKNIYVKINEENGNIEEVIRKIARTPENIEDARLILATSLLLQDIQAWQDLWYEGSKRGTPLYIVAPVLFHDAMNRLNMCWGHGGTDYRYRAMVLRNNESPFFDIYDEEKAPGYREQGLSTKEFEKKVSKFLD
jgi:hypothetical protein